MKPSTLSTIILTIAIFAINTQANQQNSFGCDFYETTDKDSVCIINETAISYPDVTIEHENDEKFNILRISGVLIEFLPIKLDQSFPNLHQYYVTKAKFSRVQKINLENLRNLKILTISSKTCTKVDKDAFEDLENLFFLNLANSAIEYFHSDTFKSLKNLEILHLLGNNLEFLHPHAFDSLNKLQILSFARNKLTTLNHQLFINKNALKLIDGYENKFEHLDETTFDGLKLRSLNLQQSGSCSLYKYKLSEGQDFINLDEVKQDIRDDCKGTDYKIYEIHAKMLEIVGKFGDKM